ncbi:MAG: tRNA (adenosine(37)-N6)-dimethylallyltransferase MiaA [Peptococcaceae bacterium]|nr:tRNA (adenosine(37)-N6)-dimethylallyltransferase MiaA [Peptococcaceae bacterium]
MKQQVLVIVGPTAVGKTELTLRLAEELDGEIISADSMQVYRGMDIGTAKASLVERERIPHHLIDVVDPGENFSAADYQRLSRQAVDGIVARGKLPIFSGGTGLYVRAAIDDYNFIEVENNYTVRDSLKQQVREAGLDALYKRLQSVDPRVAQRLHSNDERRIVRALEVYETTGQTLSFWEQQKDVNKSVYDAIFIGLNRPREELYARVNLRIEQMIKEGLVDEVKSLVDMGLSFVAQQALGYKELLPYLEGRLTLEEAKELIKLQTRRYAKRQLTWFRADTRVKWVDVTNMEQAQQEILPILAKQWQI